MTRPVLWARFGATADALGYFLREAQMQPWFDDTIFVVIADHGVRVYGKETASELFQSHRYE